MDHDPFQPALPGGMTYTSRGEQKVENLLLTRIPDADNPEKALGERDCSLASKLANVEIVMRNHEKKLVELINEYQAAVGCVAWLTSEPILEALARLSAVSIVVQKEDFLRPDSFSSYQRTRDLYRRLTPFPLFEIGGGLNTHSPEDVGVSIRCAGIHNADKKPAIARMHHKFMALGDRIREVYDELGVEWAVSRFVPRVVWTGSFNFTHNGARSLENAVIIDDEVIAQSFVSEFTAILGISEPLCWDRPWVAPEFRLGT